MQSRKSLGVNDEWATFIFFKILYLCSQSFLFSKNRFRNILVNRRYDRFKTFTFIIVRFFQVILDKSQQFILLFRLIAETANLLFVSTSSESCFSLSLFRVHFQFPVNDCFPGLTCLLSFGNNFDKLYQWFVQNNTNY
jgi:hypothetical protein